MKNKILATIVAALFAAVSLNAAAPVVAASPVSVSADATYYTKFLNKGVVAFDDVIVAGANINAYGFVLGLTSYNTIQDNTVGKKVSESGLFKRLDTTLGYKFTAPLANLTLGTTYSSYSKSVSNLASTNEPFALLDGKFFGRSTWDVKARADLKAHTNNLEANVRLPFGFNNLKVVPSLGYGFNDPGATTIAAFKDAKQYAIVGLGVGYYTNIATLNAGVYQRRDTLFTAGDTVNGVSAGLSVKF
jgi:hypothetical protein